MRTENSSGLAVLWGSCLSGLQLAPREKSLSLFNYQYPSEMDWNQNSTYTDFQLPARFWYKCRLVLGKWHVMGWEFNNLRGREKSRPVIFSLFLSNVLPSVNSQTITTPTLIESTVNMQWRAGGAIIIPPWITKRTEKYAFHSNRG